MIQNLINHISLIVDKSGSMRSQPVVRVFDTELRNLKQRSIELNQETRISIYLFDDKIECLAFDMDVMRFDSLEGHYRLGGQTALIDAVMQSIRDHTHLPQMYGDHAFLQYVLTDGGENNSYKNTPTDLRNALTTLPDNWTVACLVPNPQCKYEAKKFGFNEDSIAMWDTTSNRGLETAGKQFGSAMSNYMAMRATGVRSTRGLFTLDTSNIRKSDLKPIPAGQYEVFPVRATNRYSQIREFVEKWTGQPYRVGSAYYEPTKPVEIQHYKSLLVMDRKNGRVYEGTHLRQLMGLPDHTVKVNPGDHKDLAVLVQSTSVNRKPVPDTVILVRK